jgi:ferredoxin-NADP reductase
VLAKEYRCKIIHKAWLSPTVMEIRFEPSKKFSFEAGQFISVVVPPPPGSPKPLRRAYSLATAPGEGWGLCVKHLPDGPGSDYLASLKEGDTFKAFAPYGDFLYKPETGLAACFISTGTGIAPLVSMIRSREFRDNPPPRVTNIFGVHTEIELIYRNQFKAMGIDEVNCVSQGSASSEVYHGRVTDYLKSLPGEWPWHATEFYLCGNGNMVSDVRNHLLGRGVPVDQIFQEVYFTAPDRRMRTLASVKRIVVPPPMKKAG